MGFKQITVVMKNAIERLRNYDTEQVLTGDPVLGVHRRAACLAHVALACAVPAPHHGAAPVQLLR